MLDVDGQVISAGELIGRVEQLLGSATAQGAGVPPPSSEGASPPGPHAAALHAARTQLHPPEAIRVPGLRGRIAWAGKRAVQRSTNWYVEPRWAVQQTYDAEAERFVAAAEHHLNRVDRELDLLRRHSSAMRMQLVGALQRITELQSLAAEFRSTQREIETLVEELRSHRATQADVATLRSEVTGMLTRLGAASTAGAQIDYAAFEDRFRGSSSQLQESQRRYLTLFPPAGIAGRIVDLGCGRGEMLELLQEAGQDVLGVDMDDAMIAACQAKGLTVVQDDANHFLQSQEPASLKGIFCAQVVEHLLTSELEELVRGAHRALQAGGVLVIETINPRSSFALGNHFYADTSHVRPVHPETLRFICEQVGFEPVQMEERSPHPLAEIADSLPAGTLEDAVGALLRSVFGYQDYIVVATR